MAFDSLENLFKQLQTSGDGFQVARITNLGDNIRDINFTGGGAVRIRSDDSSITTVSTGDAPRAFLAANADFATQNGVNFFANDADRAAGTALSVQQSPQQTQGTGAVPTLQDAVNQQNPLPDAVRARNPLIGKVQDAQSQSLANQQSVLGRAPAGREAILAASPQLRAASQALLQQAQDPGGGGFREDFQERIRVQQAAAGLSGGNQAAFQEAALTSGALQQRRQQAASGLQRLGGSFLQQLGIGGPVVADLAGIGQTELASQTLSAITAANQAQAELSQSIFEQISGFLNQREINRTNQRTLFGGGGFGGQVIPPGVSVTTGGL